MYSGRTKSGRKTGGQKGHKGTTLTKADVEEKIRSGRCRYEIREIGNPPGNKYIKKYVVDLDVIPQITEIRIYPDKDGRIRVPAEYRSDVTYGADVKALAVALYSEGVMSNDRIAAFLNAASGDILELSEGSVYGFCRKLSGAAQESIRHLEGHLLDQKVVMTDATPVTVNGKQNYIRNFSIKDTVVYRALESKSIPALERLDFLQRYAGTLVHDHETALYHFGTGHGECNIHLLRYLRKNTEETGNSWSEETAALVRKMNRDQNHLLFLYDFSVPFDNNMSERDLRKAKNREKMAGGFRKKSGNEMYCGILTAIETLKRRKMGIIENLKKLFMGTPAIF